MNRLCHIAFLACIASFFACKLISQDTVILTDTTEVSTTNNSKNGVFSMFDGKPGKAGLYSLILPGAGQLYNKKYWKVPLFVGAEVGAILLLNYTISDYNTWDDGYTQLAEGTITDFMGLTSVSSVRSIRDNKRQAKDYSWIALIAVHIITAADAFVDRHLIEFDVKDDIEVSIVPANNSAGLALYISF